MARHRVNAGVNLDRLHLETVSGPPCPFLIHGLGSLDGQIRRYSDTHACVQCIARLPRRVPHLDVAEIEPTYWRRHFLNFWSLVDIRGDDDCWTWQGTTESTPGRLGVYMPRHWNRSSYFLPSRVATWFSWGDIGRLPIGQTCGNTRCVNPWHQRIGGVTHLHWRNKAQRQRFQIGIFDLRNHITEHLRALREDDWRAFHVLQKESPQWISHRLEGGAKDGS